MRLLYSSFYERKSTRLFLADCQLIENSAVVQFLNMSRLANYTQNLISNSMICFYLRANTILFMLETYTFELTTTYILLNKTVVKHT